ncbi:MAG: hypothetical protein IJO74_03020 [Clostridia bacterium]|nr:hypothetical protein [Clostridia bacterium]
MKKSSLSQCETCAYYDITDPDGEMECTVSLDEDEVISLTSYEKSSCPYYKFYDEYKLVQKQN